MDHEQRMTGVEALLFAAGKPLAASAVARMLQISLAEAEETLVTFAEEKNRPESGIHVIHYGDEWQLATNPKCAEIVRRFTEREAGELTRPGLETLAVVAYRGPITQPEIEAIRGVTCTLVLRNLLARGLVTETMDSIRNQMVYRISLDALRYLGVHDISELPEYANLHSDSRVDAALAALMGGAPSSTV